MGAKGTHITTSSICPTPKFRIILVFIRSPPVCIKRTHKGIKGKIMFIRMFPLENL